MVCDVLPPLPSSVVPEGTMNGAEGSLTMGGNHDSTVHYPLLDRGTNGILLETSQHSCHRPSGICSESHL